MNIYRRVGLSLSLFVGVVSLLLLRGYVMPMVFSVLSLSLALYYYLMWTRGLALKPLLAVVFVPIVAVPLYIFLKTTGDPNVLLSMMAALPMAFSINLLVFGSSAIPRKNKAITA